MYSIRPTKELSPSFWYSEGKTAADAEGLEDIMSGIEHPLGSSWHPFYSSCINKIRPPGRLLYTTGDVAGAVKLFLGLLRGSSAFTSAGHLALPDGTPKHSSNDKLYLDDFRVAFNVSTTFH